MRSSKIQNKGEMGIGTLVIFIALLLVVAVAAGVLIQTTNSMQEKALTTGEEAKSQIVTSINPVEITLEKDSNGDYKLIKQIIKLSPGSEAIKLDNLISSINLYDTMSTFEYKGTGASLENSDSGYMTRAPQEIGLTGNYYEKESTNILFDSWNDIATVDYDLDNETDYIRLCPEGGEDACGGGYDTGNYIVLNISSYGLIYVQLVDAGGAPVDNLCDAVAENTPIFNNKTAVGSYGYISVIGTDTDGDCRIETSSIDVEYYLNDVSLTEDIDKDGNSSDYLNVNQTHVIFHFSDGDIVSYPLTNSIANAPAVQNVDTNIFDSESEHLGKLIVSGTTTYDNIIDADMTFTVIPGSTSGYYVAEYIQKGTRYKEGNIVEGDLVRLYYEAPRAIIEDEKISFTLLPDRGLPEKIDAYSPSTMNKDVITIFP